MAEVIEIVEKKIDFKKRIITYKGIDTNYDGFPYRINLGNHLTDLFTQDFAVGNEIRSGDLINIHSELDSQRAKLNSYIDEINTYKASKSYLSSLGDIDSIPALYVPENAYQDDLNYTLLSDYVNNIKYLKQAQLDIQNKLHEVREKTLYYARSFIFTRTDGINYPVFIGIRPSFSTSIYPDPIYPLLEDLFDVFNADNANASYFEGENIISKYDREWEGEGDYSNYVYYYTKEIEKVEVANYGSTDYRFSLQFSHEIININEIEFKKISITEAKIEFYDTEYEKWATNASGCGTSTSISMYQPEYLNYTSRILDDGSVVRVPSEFKDLTLTKKEDLTLDFIQKFEL